eukprot:15458303-Alexandrium_andersonii.AAC.1
MRRMRCSGCPGGRKPFGEGAARSNAKPTQATSSCQQPAQSSIHELQSLCLQPLPQAPAARRKHQSKGPRGTETPPA